jgi:hypothetical protein
MKVSRRKGPVTWYLELEVVENVCLLRKRSERMNKELVDSQFFKSGEVIKRSGISRQVLYQYTAMGLVEEAQRTKHGHRLYDEEVFQRLHIIRELNASGYPLKDIKEIFFSDKKVEFKPA